jgi:hypothetical protein
MVSDLQRKKFRVISVKGHFVPAPPKKAPAKVPKKPPPVEEPRSAIIDVFVTGAETWNTKFVEFIRSTTYDPALGYPLAPARDSSTRDTTLDTNTAFDNLTHNPITYDSYLDLHGGEEGSALGVGALGGGDVFDGCE